MKINKIIQEIWWKALKGGLRLQSKKQEIDFAKAGESRRSEKLQKQGENRSFLDSGLWGGSKNGLTTWPKNGLTTWPKNGPINMPTFEPKNCELK